MSRVLLIAPAGQKRERLEELLDSAGAEVVGSADELEELDEDFAEGARIVVVDASAEPLDEMLETLQETGILRESAVVLLAEQVPALWASQAVRVGVRAVLPVDIRARQLSTALDAVADGLVVLHPSEVQLPRVSARSTANNGIEIVEPLTSREREVLQLLARGLGNKKIAGRMKISEHTVKFHVASILGKLGAATRTEAATLAMQRGLVLI